MAASPVHPWTSALLTGAGAAVVLAGAVAFLSLPGTVDDKLAAAVRGVCAQRVSHSLLVGGQPLALEARMYGIFTGFALSVGLGWARGRWRRSELPRGALAALLGAGILAMGVDGLNAWLADLGASHLYPPRNDLRLATGLLAGLGMAGYMAPVISFVFWRDHDSRPLIASGRELLETVAGVATAGWLVASGVLGATGLSALGVLSVVLSFSLVNSYLAVLLWRGPGAAADWRELRPELIVGLILTAGELVLLAALRGWMEASLGVTWAA